MRFNFVLFNLPFAEAKNAFRTGCVALPSLTSSNVTVQIMRQSLFLLLQFISFFFVAIALSSSHVMLLTPY